MAAQISTSDSFDRLIRFIDNEGRNLYGNLEQALSSNEILGKEVQVLSGSLEKGFTKTDERVKVKQLLAPISDVPAVLCVGLNFKQHVQEASGDVPLPKKPVIFMTPAERLCGPLDDTVVHPEGQPELDYEGELCFVIGKDAKNVREEDALDYILGYTVGNDVSARNMVAMDIAFNQMGHSKSFDTFGPVGPCIVSPKLIDDPHKLHLVTKVNGQVRQDAQTADMIWTVKDILTWVSQNRTIKRGTVVMTGTPSGVGWHSGGLLKNGDVVEVDISGIGSITNKVVFL